MAKKQDLDILTGALRALVTPETPADQISYLRIKFLGSEGLLEKLTAEVAKLPYAERAAQNAILTTFRQDLNAILG